MIDLREVDIYDPLGSHYLNKSRRAWYKVLPGQYGGLILPDLARKYNLSITGITDASVSGWRRINRYGQYGYLQFDGVDDRASGLAGPSMQNNYTLASTVYIDSTSNKGCFIKAGDTTQGFGIGIGSANYDTNGNDLIALVESVRWQTLSAAVGTGWLRVAVSLASSGAIVAYINGTQVYSGTGTGANAPGSFNLYIGGYTSTAGGTNTPRYFRGPVDNACLYSKVLTAAEVKDDWKLEQCGFVYALNFIKRKTFLIMNLGPLFSASINFRGGEATAPDLPGQTYCVADNWTDTPTRAGLTFGWSGGAYAAVDRTVFGPPYDPEFHGVNYTNTAYGGSNFLIRLPVAGVYGIRLALGDHYATDRMGCTIHDGQGGPILATVLNNNSSDSDQYFDATGVLRTSPGLWRADNARRVVTTTGTVLAIRIGDPSISSGTYTLIAHLDIESLPAAPVPTTPVGIGGSASWDLRGPVGLTGTASWGLAAAPLAPGTLFRDDFLDSTIGPDWAAHGGTWTESGAKVSQVDISAIDPKRLQVEGVDFPDEIEIKAKIRVDTWNGTDYSRAGLCIGGDANGRGYNFLFHKDQSTVQFLNDGVAWGNSYKFNWNIGAWYWMRMQLVGGTLSGKVWAEADPEPAAYQLTQAYGPRSGAPGCNGGAFDGSTASFKDFYVIDPNYAPAPTPVGISGVASWDTRAAVGATWNAAFDVHASVGATLTSTFDIHTSVGVTLESIYNVRMSTGLSVSVAWDVLPAPVPIELQPVGLTGSAAWDVRAAVGVVGDASWNISELANISGSAAWSVLATVHVIGTVAWNDRIPAGWEGSAIWANMLPVGLTAGAAWGVRAPARIAANALWSVRAVVGVSRVDSWRDRVLAGLERSASWSLRRLAGLVNGATWDVDTVLAHWPVGIGGSLVWADRNRLGLGGLITWNDRQPRGLTRSATYDIHKNTRINGDIRFHVRSRVGTVGLASWRLRLLERITYTSIWNCRSLSGVAAVAGWNVRARVGMLRESGWSDRRPVGMSLSGAWQDRSRAGIAGAGNWRTLARVGPNLHAYWNIRESIGVGAGASWDLRGVVALSGAVRFLTFRATPPAPIDYDPAAVAAFLESRHGSGPWGTYPDPGSVRIDHDYPAPDSMRALRGEDGIPGVSIRIYDKSDYENGFRADPAAVRARSLTGPDGRWISSVYLIPGEYVILYRESERFPVADYLTVIGPVPGREPPGLTEADINNPYYELDYLLSLGHGLGEWGPGSGLRGPSPIDHHYGGPDRYTLTRYGRGLGGVIIYIYTESDYNAGRTGNRYRIGHSRTNESGRWDWPVDLYPGRYVAVGWKEGLANTFIIEVT